MLNQLSVDLGERSYPIYINHGIFADTSYLAKHIKTRKVVLITNDVVAPLYLEPITSLLNDYDLNHFILPDGEDKKTLASFEAIMSFMLEVHASRDTTIVALGGGVIGDMAGFAAACFQRGVPFIQIPTTLLSQVDSSVGGKTAVNHPLGKNMIGAFYQPNAVLIDTMTLNTLPPREFASGMAEVIKYGIIYDAEFFDWLEREQDSIKAKTPNVLAKMIHRCCEIKAEVVSKDEKEAGLRALLNLGHTFGHAIEAEMGYGNWLHGEAVAAGMMMACKVAWQKQWLSSSELQRVKALLTAFNLPIDCPENMTIEQFMQHMQHDKKVIDGRIRFIIPQGIGSAVVTDQVDRHELNNLFV